MHDDRSKAVYYPRVVLHGRDHWQPGIFQYACDTEIKNAKVTPTGIEGLVRVRGMATVWKFTHDPKAEYEIRHWHWDWSRFPFVRVDRQKIPLGEAIKTYGLDAWHGDYPVDWRCFGTEPYDSVVPVTKIEAQPPAEADLSAAMSFRH